VLQAHRGYASAHDGARYELPLGERRFFELVASLKQERRIQTMFSEHNKDQLTDYVGWVATDDCYNDGGRLRQINRESDNSTDTSIRALATGSLD
jgi:hypothetical protein